MASIALIGECDPSFKSHAATNAAIQHSCQVLGVRVQSAWISTENIAESLFDDFAGVWVAPGSPYKNMERTLWAIRQARERDIPCFGTCGGFQHMVLEYARNVLGFRDAQHAEYDPYASDLFIAELACSLARREMALTFVEGSRIADMYGATSAAEEYYCNFGVHPEKVDLLKSGALRITGADTKGDMRVIELPDHPFFVATLFVPQARSNPGKPHPLVTAFIDATIRAKEPVAKTRNATQQANAADACRRR